jgi:hypothetical protein
MGAAAPAKTARAAKVAKKATRAVAVPADPDDVPAELRGFYDNSPPQLSRARGAGTTGPAGSDLDFDTTMEDEPVPMEKLFSIDGEPYFIPVEFPVGYSIIYMDALDEGRDIAIGRVLKLAMGEAWTRLVELATKRPGLVRPEHLSRIMGVVLQKIMGTIEEAGEGN